jgi:hypothetical protein
MSSPRAVQATVDADQEYGGVDADIVYADEGTTKFVELKPEEVDDVEDEVVEISFFRLPVQCVCIRNIFLPVYASFGDSLFSEMYVC